jgi:hypothetical protein
MSAGSAFANSLRVRPEVVALAAEDASAWMIRVQAADAWDAVRVRCTPETPVATIKHAAMGHLLPDVQERDGYVVKLHGADVRNEALTLAAAGGVPASTLCLVSRRRRPLK